MITANLETLNDLAKDHLTLFADLAHIVTKAPEDFTAVVKTRISEHKEAEAKRIEAAKAEAEREEQERIAKEAAQQNTPPQAARSPEPENAPALVRPAVSVSAQTVVQPADTKAETQGTAWKIAGLIADMTEQEREMVLHYCERLIGQRQAAA